MAQAGVGRDLISYLEGTARLGKMGRAGTVLLVELSSPATSSNVVVVQALADALL